MIKAQTVLLVDARDRPAARGVVAIDTDEGAPRLIFWEGGAFLLRLAAGGDELSYRKTRVMYAGANFEAVR